MRAGALSLATKLRLLTTGAVLLTTLSVLGVAARRAINDSAERLVRKGQTLGLMIAQNSEFAVYTQNADALRQIAQGLRADPEVAYVRFQAADGHELHAEVLLPGYELPPFSRSLPRSAGAAEQQVQIVHRPAEERVVEALARVGGAEATAGGLLSGDVMAQQSGPRSVGVVQIGLSEELTRAELNGFLRSAIVAALLLTGVGVLLANLVLRRISAPIGALVRATEGVARGDLDVQIEAGGSKEIAVLARSFRGMVERLRAYRGEVQEYQRGLEQKVEERTRQLEATTQEARELARQAEEASRAKSQCLANMSHEIRTPMNGVVGMTQLLLRTSLSPQQQRYAETVRVSAESLLNVINDILDFSKVEAGRLELEELDFDLRETVESVCDLLAQRAHDKALELVVVVDEAVPDALVGDAGRLRQVLMNLIGNAVKFTEKGEVSIRVGLVGSDGQGVCLRFEVRDTGIGISPEALPRLFHAFVQADGSTTRRYGGTGLGLAISRQIVGLMGGTIEAESTLNSGSVFRFTARFVQRPTDQSQRAGRRAELQGKRTLVVDDNATNREVLARSLQSNGMAVTCASDGPSALRIALEAASRGTPYELAVLDMMMPGMDGLQLARAIRGSPELPTMGLLLLTSVGGQGEPDEARRAGVDAYLTKPIRQVQLLDALVSMLGRAATRRPQASPPPLATSLSAPGARVLVVDDNVVNRAVIVGMLEAYECVTSEAEDGAAAVRKAAESDFDLVFMDCQMPVLDGFEATAELRRQEEATGRRRVPIVALTASALKGERERCLAAGMDDYLSKPVRQEQLGEMVRRWVSVRLPVETNGKHVAPPEANGKNGNHGNGVLDHSVIDSIRAMPSHRAGDTLSRLVGIYLQHTPAAIRQLRAAADGGQCGEAQRVAHTIKSSSAMLGATGLARLLSDAETAGRENAGDSLARIVGAIEVEYEAVERALTDLLPSGANA